MGTPLDYAVHRESTGEVLDPRGALFRAQETDWDSYCAAAVVWSNEVIGALVQVTSAETMMRSLFQMRDRTLFILVLTAAAALAASLILARVMTRPINRLMRGIQHMSRGDFSSRVVVKGSGEMRRLAQAFNAMSEKVETLDQSRNQFVSNASHELKTPLAVISANADVLAAEAGESKPLQYIQSEVQRSDRLSQSLLILARMEKGTVQAAREKFDMSRAMLEVALPFESTVFDEGKTMEMEIPDGIEYTGDQEMIKQLTVILLSNAEKYSDEGGKIRVSLEAKGEKRVLKVHNTGPVIPPEAQQRIFDRFYRVESSHNREVEGNGLGLAIAQSIVSAHKGKITVRSSQGEGTEFTVTL
jgi:signal transduction histidine kinase